MKKKYRSLICLAVMLLLAGCANSAGQQEVLESIEEIPIAADSDAAQPDATETQEAAAVKSTEEELDAGKETQAETKGTIRVGTIGSPYDELLNRAKMILAKDGWEVAVEVYDDVAKLNQDVLNGTLDAHLFAHQTYLDSYNEINGTALRAVYPICYEKYGLYSKTNADSVGNTDKTGSEDSADRKTPGGIAKLSPDVSVGIPADDTGQARALLFLEELGFIGLPEDASLTVVTEDIVENPHGIRLIEYTDETVKEVLKEADYCVMGGNQAILAGMDPHKDMLLEETPQMKSAKIMAAQLVTAAKNAENEKLHILAEAFQTEAMLKYVAEYYKEAVALCEE